MLIIFKVINRDSDTKAQLTTGVFGLLSCLSATGLLDRPILQSFL